MANILQILAQKMGKSTDEVLEALGKKAGTTGEEVSEAATMANLQREAADAAVPMGSGKNLDALQSASDDIATATKTAELQKGALNAPYVDAERNINNANLGLSYDDAPAAQYKVPAPDGIKASQAAPASLADTASKLQGSVNIDRMDPRLKGVAAALGLGGLGYGMMGGEESPQIPFAPNAKQEVPPTAPDMITPVKRAASSAIAAPKSDSLDFKALENTFDKGMAGLPQEPTEEIAPVSEQPDYSSLMREAQQSSNQNDFYNHLLRSGNQAGAAIASLGAGSQVKADYSGVDALEKTAGKPVSDIKGLMETKSSEQKLKAAQEELSDDAKMRDPNSEVSKLTAELAAKAGLIKPGQVMSAQALKNSGVNIGNLLSTIEAGKARKEAANLQREFLSDNKSTQGLNKHIDTYNKSLQKNYDDFTKTQANISALDTIMSDAKNGVTPGAKDVSLLYSFISGLDPSSTVREGEVQLSKGAMSLWGKIKSGTKQITGGDLLDQDTRDSFMEIMRAGAKAQENRFKKTKVNAVNAGKEKGYDPEILNRAIYGDVDVGIANSQKSQGLTTEIVKVRRIKDGLTKDMPASSAANIDKTKYEIVK